MPPTETPDPAAEAPSPATETPTGAPQAPNGGEGRTFSQADVDRIVAERLERQRAQFKAQQERAAEEAKAQALKEQGEYRQLYETAAAKLAEAEQGAAHAARYEAALKRLLATQREGLPEHILPLLDAMDPADQLAYLAEHGAKLRPAPAAEPPAATPPARGTPGGQRASRPAPAPASPEAPPARPQRTIIF